MDQRTTDLKRKLAGVALILAPLCYIPADYALYTLKDVFLAFILGEIVLVIWLPAILGVYHSFRARAELWGLMAAGSCLIGLLSGMTIFTFNVVADVIQRAAANGEQISPTVVAGLRSIAPLVFLPALLFPLGMLLFGIGMLRHRLLPVWVGVLWLLGSVLFPVGRIPDTDWIVFSSDVLLLIAMGWVGFRYLIHRTSWYREDVICVENDSMSSGSLRGSPFQSSGNAPGSNF